MWLLLACDSTPNASLPGGGGGDQADTAGNADTDSNTEDPPAEPTWTCASGETMRFDPSPVRADVPLTVSVTGSTGYVYVDLAFDGPATVAWIGVTGTGPYTWSWSVTGLTEGTWSAAFTADNGVTRICEASVPVTGTPTDTDPVDPGTFSVSGASILRAGAPFRFVGFNARGLSHYGGGDILPYTSAADVTATLDAVAASGGTVVRVFAANQAVSDQVAADRLSALLDTCEARGIYVIAALTDEYATGFSPAGDGGGYAVDGNGYTVLTHEWYAGGWRDHYLGWVRTVVAQNAGHPALLGWEAGNETKDPYYPDTWVSWLADVSAEIRGLDPDTLQIAGTIDVASTFTSSTNIAKSVDVLTVHLYDGATSPDLDLGLPVLVEEMGFSGGGRPDSVRGHAGWAFGAGGDGYMQWGLMASSADHGDGDRTYGMDKVFHDDWDGLLSAYAEVASGL